jgi:hypothetical protein
MIYIIHTFWKGEGRGQRGKVGKKNYTKKRIKLYIIK